MNKELLFFIRLLFIMILPTVAFAQIDNKPLPDCRYDDIPAGNQRYRDWQITILDTIYMLDANYAPDDLVSLAELGFNPKLSLRSFVLEDLKQLLADAKLAGNPLEIQSSYRSYDYQKSTFKYWVDHVGEQEALLTSARAGHSEHQLGTTVDFKSLGDKAAWSYDDWATSPAGSWLKENARFYGFVMSYPKDKTAISCYSYEPWHYRYIGAEYAKAVYDSGLTLREWLWSLQNYLRKD